MSKQLILLSIMSFNIYASELISTESQFKSVIQNVYDLYKSQFRAPVTFDIKWDSETQNASVGYSSKSAKINFSFHGGFVRDNKLTTDGFAITVCHEIGHILGGYPKVFPTQKYTAEGQADYFATNECLVKYFGDRDIQRGLEAIKNELVIYKGGSMEGEDNSSVEFTIFNDYPSAQCRIDTLKAGLYNYERPSCWFSTNNPREYEYVFNYTYNEALVFGEVDKVTKLDFGCAYEVGFLDFWQPSYLNPLEESTITNNQIIEVSGCSYKVGEELSGAITEYRGELYFNLNPTDK